MSLIECGYSSKACMIICLLKYLFAVAPVMWLFCHNTYANNLPLI